jgi:hypothetical protein
MSLFNHYISSAMTNPMNKWMGLSWVQLLSHVMSSLFTEDFKEQAVTGTAYKLHY